MDLTILFMLGLVGGVTVGLVTSRRAKRGRSRSSTRRRISVKPRSRPRADSARAKRVDSHHSVDSQTSSFKAASRRTQVEGIPHGPGLPIIIHSTRSPKAIDVQVAARILDRPTNLLAFATCPSCGLETSDLLMSEHFLSSPSHRLGRKEVVEKQDGKNALPEEEPMTAEEHRTGVMRNLLSMLAPPRAFGRRHMQQNENPFSDFIQRPMQVGPATLPKNLNNPIDN